MGLTSREEVEEGRRATFITFTAVPKWARKPSKERSSLQLILEPKRLSNMIKHLLVTALFFSCGKFFVMSYNTSFTNSIFSIAYAQLDGGRLTSNRRSDGPKYDTYDTDYVDEIPFTSPQRPRTRTNLTPQRPNRPNQIPSDCRSKTRSIAHEKYCDLYYHTTGCDDGQSLLRSCPNGLLFKHDGRPGLIGVCDYPHNVDCNGKEKHSKLSHFLLQCMDKKS